MPIYNPNVTLNPKPLIFGYYNPQEKASPMVYRAIKPSSVLPYLEGQGDLLSRLMMGITRVTIWLLYGLGVIHLLAKYA